MAQVRARRAAATATKNKTPASTIAHSNSEAPSRTSRRTEHEAAHKKVSARVDSDEDLPEVLSRRGPEATARVSQALAKPGRTEHEVARKKAPACVDPDEDLSEVPPRNGPEVTTHVPPTKYRRSEHEGEHEVARKKVSTRHVGSDEDLPEVQSRNTGYTVRLMHCVTVVGVKSAMQYDDSRVLRRDALAMHK